MLKGIVDDDHVWLHSGVREVAIAYFTAEAGADNKMDIEELGRWLLKVRHA